VYGAASTLQLLEELVHCQPALPNERTKRSTRHVAVRRDHEDRWPIWARQGNMAALPSPRDDAKTGALEGA
jgi:hypothetical protein